MPVERIKIEQIRPRIALVKGRGEEATKQALVLPMLDALGFDIWNPAEVCPEFDADFATKKLGQKEKVDLAILLNNIPRVYIEVKAVDIVLDGHEGQLARYFNATPSVSLAVLTNGIEYRFYTDTREQNLMDSTPFYSYRVDSIDQGLDVLARFSRSQLSADAVRDYATELNYTNKVVHFLRDQLDLREREPNDQLVRWVLGADGMYEGLKHATVISRFRPIVKNALQVVLRDVVRRSVAALDDGVSAPTPTPAAPPPVESPHPSSSLPPGSTSPVAAAVLAMESIEAETEEAKAKAVAVTTERELAAFEIIKGQFGNSVLSQRTVFEPSQRREVSIQLNYKDTTSYFGVYFNKPGWWFARLVLEAKSPWIGLNITPEKIQHLLPPGMALLPSSPWAPTRVAIGGPGDLHALSGALFAAMQEAIDIRKAGAPEQNPGGGE